MMEQPERTQEICEVCLSVYRDTKSDWMPASELIQELKDRGSVVGGSDLSRLMREFDQKRDMREYEGKLTGGYTRRNFQLIQNQLEAASQREDDAKQEHDLDMCAERLLVWISSLDPDWRMLVEALNDERGFDAKTTIASFAGYVLDNRLHMIVPRNETLQGVHWTPEEQLCPICSDVYTMSYPGQPCCLKSECGRLYHQQVQV